MNMKYDIKFKGTEEQIQKIVEILKGQGFKYTPCEDKNQLTNLFVYGITDNQPFLACQHLTPIMYDTHKFKEVGPAGFIDAHSDMPGNPWNVNTGIAPNTEDALLRVLCTGDAEDHEYRTVRGFGRDTHTWYWDNCGSGTILKWRFANMEDAEKYYNKEKFMSGFGVGEGKLSYDQYASEDEQIAVAHEEIKQHLEAAKIFEKSMQYAEDFKEINSQLEAQQKRGGIISFERAAELINGAKKHPLPEASEILTEAASVISQRGEERDKGNKERSMLSCVNAFNALTGHTLTEEAGWLFMVVLKMARSQGGRFKLDDYLDGAAYFALAGEAAAKAA